MQNCKVISKAAFGIFAVKLNVTKLLFQATLIVESECRNTFHGTLNFLLIILTKEMLCELLLIFRYTSTYIEIIFSIEISICR